MIQITVREDVISRTDLFSLPIIVSKLHLRVVSTFLRSVKPLSDLGEIRDEARRLLLSWEHIFIFPFNWRVLAVNRLVKRVVDHIESLFGRLR